MKKEEALMLVAAFVLIIFSIYKYNALVNDYNKTVNSSNVINAEATNEINRLREKINTMQSVCSMNSLISNVIKHNNGKKVKDGFYAVVAGYTTSVDECGKSDGTTKYKEQDAIPWVTAAVTDDLYNKYKGMYVYIPDFNIVLRINDGKAGKNGFDVCVNTKSEAFNIIGNKKRLIIPLH